MTPWIATPRHILRRLAAVSEDDGVARAHLVADDRVQPRLMVSGLLLAVQQHQARALAVQVHDALRGDLVDVAAGGGREIVDRHLHAQQRHRLLQHQIEIEGQDARDEAVLQ